MEQIQIDQGFGQIGIKITPPDLKYKIKQPEADIKIRQADLQLKIEKPEVIVDLRQSFNTMGLQDIDTLSRSMGDEAKQTLLKGIERRVTEGEELAKPKGASVGKIVAASAATEIPKKELVIGLMPAVPPKITARLGQVKGFYTPGNVAVKLDKGELNGTFTWGKVDVYMEREPYIDIKA